MTYPTWPPGLPTAIEINGLTETPIDQWIEMNVDTGSPKRRLRFTGLMANLKGKMTMSTAQLAQFDTFFNSTLAYGSQPFQWIRPSTGGTVVMRFLSQSPARSAMGVGFWKLDFQVRIDPS
jgi:hypothetical protein